MITARDVPKAAANVLMLAAKQLSKCQQEYSLFCRPFVLFHNTIRY
jgi:hypothetical protein